MRTTLDLDDKLLARARKSAGERGMTLTAVIEEALAAALAARPKREEPFVLAWHPRHGRYIGGVDIADRRALQDVMDDRR